MQLEQLATILCIGTLSHGPSLVYADTCPKYKKSLSKNNNIHKYLNKNSRCKKSILVQQPRKSN